jgi:glycosyltransferase involved in cell wall biosynthesis
MSATILYVQYTCPAFVGPLEHGSRILADAGWCVLFLGIGSPGSSDALVSPPHPRIRTRLLPYCPPGWRQKLHYAGYMLWALGWLAWARWEAVYCSDTLTAPVGLLAHWLLRVPVIYHEHDSPGPPRSVLMRVCGAARRRLARAARMCVLPNGERLARFTALRPRRSACVWNCPRQDEVMPPRAPGHQGSLTLWYHGSLTPGQLPTAVVHSLRLLPPGVKLLFAGYETIGHLAYVKQLLQLAEQLGLSNRVSYLGTRASRQELFAAAAQADVGLVLFDRQFRQPMAGASQKPFDYLACGLALLVTDTPEWEDLYVRAGYARSCDPHTPEAIAAAVRWFLVHPAETGAMGESGRRRVAAEWNYENQFRPVAELIGRPWGRLGEQGSPTGPRVTCGPLTPFPGERLSRKS